MLPCLMKMNLDITFFTTGTSQNNNKISFFAEVPGFQKLCGLKATVEFSGSK